MPATTPNMQLNKPLTTETADITIINNNMDVLDGHRHLGGTDGLPARAVQNSARPAPANNTAGQLFVATDTPPAVYFNPGSGWLPVAGSQVITEYALGQTATQIDFDSIPPGYRHLSLIIYGRTDGTITNSTIAIRFNSDAGNNYDRAWAQFYGGGPTMGTTRGGYIIVGSLPSANAPANAFGGLDVLIHNFSNSANQKTATARSTYKIGVDADSDIRLYETAGFWRSNSAINRISVIPISTGAGSFMAGTVATLIGVGLAT